MIINNVVLRLLERDRLYIVSIVAANAVPLGGALLTDGRLIIVTSVLYWLDSCLRMLRGLVAGLFAAYREPESVRTTLALTLNLPVGVDFESMRGSFNVGDKIPPVNACNLRLFMTYLPFVLALLLPGCFAIGFSTDVSTLFGPAGGAMLLVGGCWLIVRHWLGLSQTFLATGVYEKTSNHAMLPTLKLITMAAVVMPLAIWVVTAPYPQSVLEGRTPTEVRYNFALLLFVAGIVKLGVELRNRWQSRARQFNCDEPGATVSTEAFGLFTATAAAPPALLGTPAGIPMTTLDTHSGRLRLRALALSLILAPVTVGAAAVVGFWVWVFFGTVAGVGIGLLVVALFILFEFIGTELNEGAMEYRAYQEEFVAYDRRLDTPQWRINATDMVNYTISASLWDRILPGDVVRLRSDDGTRRFTVRSPGNARRALERLAGPE